MNERLSPSTNSTFAAPSLNDLLGFVTGNHAPGSSFEGMQAHPHTQSRPQPFVLGASGATAEIAAQAGLGFTFAHFINPTGDGPILRSPYNYNGLPTTMAPMKS
ncbi:hypothetical protein [Pseudomonas viridiflava]|uniref:hypothetical protein n=1 Tax=Pseudomonas viridiflava TaxID=33069 RepID=UPI0020BFBDF2|nr:hypothetical protein [Pseudomonas viridiflava]